MGGRSTALRDAMPSTTNRRITLISAITAAINPALRFDLAARDAMLVCQRQGHTAGRRQTKRIKMTVATEISAAREAAADHEQKQLALAYLQEGWAEAHHYGVDGDCLAQTALFLALAELISTYGEEATARYAENLAPRIRNGEFSVELSRQ